MTEADDPFIGVYIAKFTPSDRDFPLLVLGRGRFSSNPVRGRNRRVGGVSVPQISCAPLPLHRPTYIPQTGRKSLAAL